MGKNLSSYSGSPPRSATNKRNKIKRGPLYPVSDVLKLLQQDRLAITATTRKCKNDLQNLGFDMSDVADLLTEALSHGQYLDSEWCVLGSNNSWAACDSYTVVRSEFVQHSNAAVSVKYYIKFAVGKTGRVLLLVSSHLS